MSVRIPDRMKAIAIDRFGGPEVIQTESLPVPRPTADQVLIRLESVGIGAWDPDVREGELGDEDKTPCPRVIGNDGAGVVVAVGENVTSVHVGDLVYGYSMLGGFYAEYVAVTEDNVAKVPPGVRLDQAGGLGADGVTALRGLQDELRLAPGERLLVFGASGGVGHIAVQLAKRIGARVLAIASGPDGVDLVRRLGADLVIDGRKGDPAKAAREFAPSGLDAALVLTAGEGLAGALAVVKRGGRVAYPNGVEPAPRVPEGVETHAYDGAPDRDALARLNRLIGKQSFHVELARTFRLEDAETAHREIERHHVGKLAFRVNGEGNA